MILFLDTVSPLPEFSLIADNKIILSKKIINNHHEKMSDYLIKSYTDLEKKFSLDQKLENLIINIGPGSYTSLRIGIAFFSGLSMSYKIDLKLPLTHRDPEFQIKITEIFFDFIFFLENITWLLSDIKFIT